MRRFFVFVNVGGGGIKKILTWMLVGKTLLRLKEPVRLRMETNSNNFPGRRNSLNKTLDLSYWYCIHIYVYIIYMKKRKRVNSKKTFPSRVTDFYLKCVMPSGSGSKKRGCKLHVKSDFKEGCSFNVDLPHA